MEQRYSYDPTCEVLASHFRPSAPLESIKALAQIIQFNIELHTADDPPEWALQKPKE